MRIITRIVSTTHVDRHGEKMSKEALDSMASQINEKFILLLVEHDFNRQIGINLYAEVFQLDDKEFTLGVVCGVFENYIEKEKYKNGQINTCAKKYKKYLNIRKLKQMQKENIVIKKNGLQYNSNIDESLEKYLDSTKVLSDGRVYKIKRFIAQTNDLKIEIYPNDHLPPHFHVISKSRNINARFHITTLEYLNDKTGTIKQKDIKKIQNFFITHPDIYDKLKNEYIRFNKS